MGEVIRRVAHFIWIAGGPELPPEYQSNLDTFKALNPGLEVRVWQKPPADGPDGLYQAYWGSPEIIQKSDILRLWVLHEYGGLYSDFDVWWRRPATELFAIAPWCASSKATPQQPAVMALPAGHPYLKAALNEVLYLCETAKTQNLRRSEYGPLLARRLAMRGHEIQALPTHWFFPVQTGAGRRAWKVADAALREQYTEAIKDRYQDGVWPYGVHLHGMGHGRTLTHGDELLRRLPRGRASLIALRGAATAEMSAYLRACSEDLAFTIASSAALVAPGSLAAVYFAGAPATHSLIESAMVWVPKLRQGGLLCGAHYPRACEAVAEIAQQLDEVWEVAWDGSWFIRMRAGVDPFHHWDPAAEFPQAERGRE